MEEASEASDFFDRALRDPGYLLDTIDRQLAAASLEDLPITTLSGQPDGEKPYRSVEDDIPHHRVMDAIVARQANALSALICVKLRYCEAKTKHGDTVSLINTVCDSLLSAALTFPIPLATVAAYCVQSLMLDRLCKCETAKA